MTKSDLIEKLRLELPAMWERIRTDELTGGVCRSRTLANKMSLGEGPGGTFRAGKKVIITREPFLDWFEERISERV
ncbi:hypothetical protein DENIS_3942 [Desulfonema ishimotonii]|uniref:DNA-binding protein n=1 Tax=Desulfonema ishimotonii TaxID=45657 RepID=A0A401G183_9BACT|nr:hypothetical protein [Desulfonema ishimotonii]GBC62957.1 hypothetical protein DENIS_3942 [Desulfonema ishimotonii]